jgi:hypothetical protein
VEPYRFCFASQWVHPPGIAFFRVTEAIWLSPRENRKDNKRPRGGGMRTVYLPCWSTIGAINRARNAKDRTLMPIFPGRGSDAAAKFLLIDRDPSSGRAMTATLSNCLVAQPHIAEARGGKEAAEILKSASFDLVMVDLASLADLAPAT